MSQYCLLHVQKLKNIGGFESHIRRHHLPHRSDPERVYLNETILRQPGTLEEAIERRIREGHTVKNKDGRTEKIHVRAVRAGSFMLTGSHERMVEIYNNKELWRQWKEANFEFVKREIGEENIINMEVHIDEKTPHIHCVFVPISQANRLSYDSFFNGTLVGLQDRYWHATKEFGFERGVSKEITGKVHQDTLEWEKKQTVALEETKKKALEITEEIKAINVLKLDKIRGNQKNIVANLIRENQNLQGDNKELKKRISVLRDQSQKAAYEQSIKEAMDERLDWIKRNIEIGPFLKDRGWQRYKKKSSQRDEVLIHPRTGEKIIVPVNPKSNGHRVFSYPGGVKKWDTLIKLLLDNNWSWEEILELAQGVPVASLHHHSIVKEIPTSRPTASPEQAKKEVAEYLDKIVIARGRDFLASREIEKRTHSGLDGLRVSTHAAVFVLYKNFDKEGHADPCSTITYKRDGEGNRVKRLQKGKSESLTKGLSVLIDSDQKLADVERIMVTESPIDALSYRQLRFLGKIEGQGSTAFLSTCGNPSFQNKDDLRIIFEMAAENNQAIVLSMDRDLAGRKMTETLIHIAEDTGCEWRVEAPKIGKDWNDQLCAKEQVEDVKEIVAQSTWRLFKDSSYEASILPLMGSAHEKECKVR